MRVPSRGDREEAIGRALEDLRHSIRHQAKGKGKGSRRAAGKGDEIVDLELERIAGRVRRWREEGDLTLQELARRSGVAASTIHKIETLQMIPTIGVLLKIARGLARSPSDLVRDSADDFGVAHLRADERHRVGIRSQMVFERMVGDIFEHRLEAWRVDLAPGTGSGPGLIRHDGEVLLICEEGTLTCRVGDREYRLAAGDALHFMATMTHAWRNAEDGPARFLIVGTLPRALRAALHERLRLSGNRADGAAEAIPPDEPTASD